MARVSPGEEVPPPRWPIYAGIIVAIGSVVTAAYAIVETFWG